MSSELYLCCWPLRFSGSFFKMNQRYSKVNAVYSKTHFGVQEVTNGSLQYNVMNQDYNGVWSTPESWIELGSVEEQLQLITVRQLFDAVWEGASTQIFPVL